MNMDVIIAEKNVPAIWQPRANPGEQETGKQVGIKVPLWYYSQE